MKSYEDLFVGMVLSELDGFLIDPETNTTGSFGGLPYIFYDSEFDVIELFSKRERRTKSKKNEDAELSSDEYEFKILRNLGLANDNKNKAHYDFIKRRISKGNKYFDDYLKRFKECSDDKERRVVIRGVISDIKEIVRRGCNCPSDYMFLRRFGLYG